MLHGGSTDQGGPNSAKAIHATLQARPATVDQLRVQTPPKWQEAGQSAPAQIVNSLPLDNMVRAVTVVQHFMEEYNGAVSSEHLSANIKLSLYKAIIRSIMTYASSPPNLRQILIC
jgi:hypothetical protein